MRWLAAKAHPSSSSAAPAISPPAGAAPGCSTSTAPRTPGSIFTTSALRRTCSNIATNGFDGLTAGETLTPGVNLINGTGPVSATPTFVYHSDALYYYSNGTGGASPVLLAALIGGPATLGANNIHIVAGPF